MPVKIEIPVVDCTQILGPYDKVKDNEFRKVAEELGTAMTGIGFAYLINHGVDLGKVEDIYEQSREFFRLPTETKRKYRKPAPSISFHGYAGPGDELLNEAKKNSIELREVWDVSGPWGRQENKFPSEEVPKWKGSFDAIRPELNNMVKKLFKCLAQHLKLEDEEFFVNRHRNLDDHSVDTHNHTQMRSMYYYTMNPKDEIPENAIRCGEHSDWGTITLLFQDMIGGLEVKTVQGDWIEATPLEGSILLNSGQLMEFWTGGHLHAAPHRVRILPEGKISTNPRQSFIYFVNPDGDETVSPVMTIKKGKEHLFTQTPVLMAYDHYQERIEGSSSVY